MKIHPETIDKPHELVWSRIEDTRGHCHHIMAPGSPHTPLSFCGQRLSVNQLRDCPTQDSYPNAIACSECLKYYKKVANA